MIKIHKINYKLTEKYTGKPVAEVITKLKMKNVVQGSCVAFKTYIKSVDLKVCYEIVDGDYLTTKILDIKYKKEIILNM